MSEYVSTRGGDAGSSFTDVLLSGQASDRGIFTPDSLPTYDGDQLRELNQIQNYPDFFVAVRSDFVGNDITYYMQQQLAKRAYTEERFPSVENGNYVPVRHVSGNLYIQALSEGPTAAFKDMALQAVGQDMNYVLNRLDKHLRIVGATSGDTGSAAEASLRGLSRVSLFMLSPIHGMSAFQRAQMAVLSGKNIHNIAVDTKFDDLQTLVETIKTEPGFEDIGAVNSINWTRVASQIPYYFSGYLQVIRQREDKVIGNEIDVAIPSGNMGNAMAAYFAKKMGLPIRKIIVATNENDVLHRLIQSGVYKPSAKALTTSSPSMDITKAKSVERLVDNLLINEQTGAHDAERVQRYMSILATDGAVSFADVGRKDISLKKVGFDSGSSTHSDRIAAIRWVYDQTDGKDIIDPHTADGVGVALRVASLDVPTLCMETAKQDKFEDVTEEALGFIPPRSREEFEKIEANLDDPKRFVILDGSLEALKNYISAHPA